MAEIAEQRTKEGYPNPEEEKFDLARMDEEAEELIALARMLVQKAQDGYRAVRRGTTTPAFRRGTLAESGGVPEITVEQVASKEGEVIIVVAPCSYLRKDHCPPSK